MLDGMDVSSIAPLERLESMSLHGTWIGDLSLEALSNSPNLRALDISACPVITTRGFATLSGFESLQALDISKNNIGSPELGLKACAPKNLRCLHLGYCTGLPPPGELLVQIGQLSRLKRLGLEATGITDEAVTETLFEYHGSYDVDGEPAERREYLPELVHLSLEDCALLSSHGLRQLFTLMRSESEGNLEELILAGCLTVGDESLEAIASNHGLRLLEKVSLARCPRVTDSGIASLQGLTRLHALHIDGTGVSQAGLHALSSRPCMKSLHVALQQRGLERAAVGSLETSPLMMPKQKGRRSRGRNGSNCSLSGSAGSPGGFGGSPGGFGGSPGGSPGGFGGAFGLGLPRSLS